MTNIEFCIANKLICYLIPSKFNCKGYDSFLFIHKSRTSSVQFDFNQDAHLLIGIKIKKNFNLVCKERKDIQHKYEEKKGEFKKCITGNKNQKLVQELNDMQWVFLFVCQSKSSNSEWRLIQGEKQVRIMFFFTDENENEKIFRVEN